MTLKMLVSGVLAAGALVAGGGTASAAAPAATVSTGTLASVAAAAGCTKNPGLGFDNSGKYWIVNASATGGCSDRPSTVTVLLLHNGVEVGRGVCQAAAGRTCFAVTRSVRWLGGEYQAR